MILTEKDIDVSIKMLEFYKRYINNEIDGKMIGFIEGKLCKYIKKLSKIYCTKFIAKEE